MCTCTNTNVTVTAASGTAVTNGNVNLRTGPGYDYNVIYLTPKGTNVTITGKSGNWYRVSVGGTTGYMLASLLKVNTNNGGNDTNTGTMNVSAYTNHKANMRTGAGDTYAIMYTLDAGEWLTVIGSFGSWYKITYNGKTGWMLKSLVQIVK